MKVTLFEYECKSVAVFSETVTFLSAVPGVPGRPQVSEVCAISCKLTWKEPATDGGTPITGYTVERRTGAGLRWIPLRMKSTTTELEVTDLFEDERYEFRVIAENKAGQSKPSEATESIIAKNPWSKSPTNFHWQSHQP